MNKFSNLHTGNTLSLTNDLHSFHSIPSIPPNYFPTLNSAFPNCFNALTQT